jgi:hypothetical protein
VLHPPLRQPSVPALSRRLARASTELPDALGVADLTKIVGAGSMICIRRAR